MPNPLGLGRQGWAQELQALIQFFASSLSICTAKFHIIKLVDFKYLVWQITPLESNTPTTSVTGHK